MLSITFPVSRKGKDQSLWEQGLLWIILDGQGVARFPTFAGPQHDCPILHRGKHVKGENPSSIPQLCWVWLFRTIYFPIPYKRKAAGRDASLGLA